MNDNYEASWVTIALLAAATVAIKATGPFLLGQRDIPAALKPAVSLLPTALMAALVTVGLVTFTPADGWDTDAARCLGVLTAIVALLARLPLVAVLGAAVATTATARMLS